MPFAYQGEPPSAPCLHLIWRPRCDARHFVCVRPGCVLHRKVESAAQSASLLCTWPL